jgi:CRISPR-associated exonuclease Cas4
MQLAGYALLVEAALGVKVARTFLFRIPDNRVFAVEVTREMRERVRAIVGSIRQMKEREEMPEATDVRGRCVECEYANYCGDVW